VTGAVPGEVHDPGPAATATGLPDVYPGPAGDGLYSPPDEGAPAAGGQRRQPRASKGPGDYQPTLLNENLGISLLVILILAMALYGFWQRQMYGVRETMAAAQQDFTRLTGLDPPDRVDSGSSWALAGYKVVLMEKEGATDQDLGLTVVVVHPGKFGGQAAQGELLDSVETRLAGLNLPFQRTGSRSLRVHGAPAQARSWNLGRNGRSFGSASAVAFQAPDGKTVVLVAAGSSGSVARTMRAVTL